MADPDDKKPAHSSDRRKRKRPSGGDVGEALRSVYDRALGEDIPPEMLDLLGKLD